MTICELMMKISAGENVGAVLSEGGRDGVEVVGLAEAETAAQLAVLRDLAIAGGEVDELRGLPAVEDSREWSIACGGDFRRDLRRVKFDAEAVENLLYSWLLVAYVRRFDEVAPSAFAEGVAKLRRAVSSFFVVPVDFEWVRCSAQDRAGKIWLTLFNSYVR